MEALLHEQESCSDRAGILIGMAACALSGGLMGFVMGVIVGLWL